MWRVGLLLGCYRGASDESSIGIVLGTPHLDTQSQSPAPYKVFVC